LIDWLGSKKREWGLFCLRCVWFVERRLWDKSIDLKERWPLWHDRSEKLERDFMMLNAFAGLARWDIRSQDAGLGMDRRVMKG
jgi:hypothetical protein